MPQASLLSSLLPFLATILAPASELRHADAHETPQASGGEVRFTVRVKSDSGTVICALFERQGWLKKPVAVARASINKGQARCIFSEVQKGTLAISAFEDENDNGDLDTNWLGIPTEPWCTSRNAPARFGPPSFDDAKFVVSESVVRLSCRAA